MRTWGRAGMAMWAVACAGCHAQVTADAQVRAVEQDERRWEVAEAEGSPGGSAALRTSPAASAVAGAAPDPAANVAAYRVVHDLSVSATAAPDLTCGCVAVSIAPATDPRFVWQPDTAPTHEAWAAALANVSCDRPNPQGRQASIAGITREANNLVLTVENVRAGVPVVRGALLPRPAAGAQLIVRTRGFSRKAAAANGAGVCQIAIP